MRSLFSREELESAQADPIKLSALVADSGGFALERMRKAGLMPRLDDLMPLAGADTLSFILDHYEVSAEQKTLLAPLFQKRMGSAKLSGGQRTEAEVDAALRAGDPLLRSARLSARQMTEMASLIAAQEKHSEYDIEHILDESAKALSPRQLSRLDRKLLKSSLGMFHSDPKFFADPACRSLYKELALEARGAKAARWADFEGWPFEPQDRDLLLSLARSKDAWRGPDYAQMAKTPGVAALLGRMEFARIVGFEDLSHLSGEDAAQNKAEIQGAWLAAVGSDRSCSKLMNFKCAEEAFEEVFDPAFAGLLLSRGTAPDFSSVYDESDAAKRKERAARRSVALAALADPQAALDVLGEHGLESIARELAERSFGPGAEGDVQIAQRVAREFIPRLLDSRSPSCARVIQGGTGLAGPKLAGALDLLREESPTPNLLAMLLCQRQRAMGRSDYQSQNESRRLLEAAKDVAARVALPSAKAAWAAFGASGGAPRAKPGAPRLGPSEHGDFLSADYARLDELGEGLPELLFKVDPRFMARLAAAGARPSEDLLLAALRELPHRLEDARALVSIDEEAAVGMARFAAAARAHEMGPLLSARFAPEGEAERLERALGLLGQSKALGGEDSQRGSPLSERASELASQARQACGGMSFAARDQALRAALGNSDSQGFLDLASILSTEGIELDAMRAARVASLDVGAFERSCADPAFRRMLVDGTGGWSPRERVGFELDFGSPADNARAAKAALPAFVSEPSKIFALFSAKAKVGFSNECALELMPQAIPYDYYLRPSLKESSGADSTNYVLRAFSPEQIVRIWDAMEAEGGWFRGKDANSRALEMLRDNFSLDAAAHGACLELALERPKLYSLLCSRELAETFGRAEREAREALAGKERGRLSRDRDAMEYSLAHWDWELRVEGARQTLREIALRSGQEGFKPQMAMGVVEQLVWTTYSEETDAAGKDVRVSLLGRDKSEALLGMLCEEAPLMVLLTRSVGCVHDVPQAIARDMRSYAGGDPLGRFLIPIEALRPQSLRIAAGEHGHAAAVEVLRAALTLMISDGMSDALARLDWEIKQKEFVEEELDWDERSTALWRESPARSDEMLGLVSQIPELKELLSLGMERLSLSEATADRGARRRKAHRI